jgi:RecB family exonuclease
VEAFARSPLCARLAAARVVRREAPFAFALDQSARSLLVNGVVDVLATDEGGAALVVDYKTNPLAHASPEEITSTDYAAQRLVYALAALRDGAPSVEVAHCYLERPDEPATATYTAADAPGLTEQLVELSRDLLGGDFTPTPTPHYELCGSCPGRRALCSHPEELTLVPYADLYAA